MSQKQTKADIQLNQATINAIAEAVLKKYNSQTIEIRPLDLMLSSLPIISKKP